MTFDLSNLTGAALLHDVTRLGLDLLGAVIILVIGWPLARWAARSLSNGLTQQPWMDATLAPLLANLLRYAILLLVLLAVLGQFGIQTTSVVTVLGATGLAIGLALQGTLANVASGIMLLMLRPFRVGESIEAVGQTGVVEEVGLFTTVVRTGDNRLASIPNNSLFNGPILNASRLPVRRTQEVALKLAFDADVEGALDMLRRMARAEPRILPDAPGAAGIRNFGETGIELTLQFTTLAADADATRFGLNLKLRQALAKSGIFLAGEVRPISKAPVPPSARAAGLR